jgi:hypothetical protein
MLRWVGNTSVWNGFASLSYGEMTKALQWHMLNVWGASYASYGYCWIITMHKVEYVLPSYSCTVMLRRAAFWKWPASPHQWPWTLLASVRTVSDGGCHAVMQLGVWWLQLGACTPMPSLRPPPRPAEQLAGCGLCRHTSHQPAAPRTSPTTQPQTIGRAMQLLPVINIQDIDAIQQTEFRVWQRLTHISKLTSLLIEHSSIWCSMSDHVRKMRCCIQQYTLCANVYGYLGNLYTSTAMISITHQKKEHWMPIPSKQAFVWSSA